MLSGQSKERNPFMKLSRHTIIFSFLDTFFVNFVHIEFR